MNASSWARAELLVGDSARTSILFEEAGGEARVSVGTHPNCEWQVRADGVTPIHLELYWTGTSLFLSDAAGPLLANGETVRGWRAVEGVVVVEFGSARLRLERHSLGPVKLSPSTEPETARLAPALLGALEDAHEGHSGAASHEEATRIDRPRPSDRSKPAFDADVTRFDPVLMKQMQEEAMRLLAATPSDAGVSEDAVLSSCAESANGAGPENSNPSEVPFAESNSDSSRIEGSRGPGPSGDPPTHIVSAKTMESPASPTSTTPPSESATLVVSSASDLSGPIRPALVGGSALAASPPSPARGQGAFALPPACAPLASPENPRVPPRTLVLGAVTLLALVVVAGSTMFEDRPPVSSAATEPLEPSASPPPTTKTREDVGGANRGSTDAPDPKPVSSTEAAPPAATVAMVPVEASTAAGELPSPPGLNEAVADVFAGRWKAALKRYRGFVETHPDDPRFAPMVRVLEGKLQGRCREGEPCLDSR